MSQTFNKPIKSKKFCTFNDNIIIHHTYSSDEYDRHCIDCILYQKIYNRISEDEWKSFLKDLDTYKNKEMIIHISNINNFYSNLNWHF